KLYVLSTIHETETAAAPRSAFGRSSARTDNDPYHHHRSWSRRLRSRMSWSDRKGKRYRPRDLAEIGKSPPASLSGYQNCLYANNGYHARQQALRKGRHLVPGRTGQQGKRRSVHLHSLQLHRTARRQLSRQTS